MSNFNGISSATSFDSSSAYDLTEERLKRFKFEWKHQLSILLKKNGEKNPSVEDFRMGALKGTVYAFGSKEACFMLAYAHRFLAPDRHRCGYSPLEKSWFYSCDVF